MCGFFVIASVTPSTMGKTINKMMVDSWKIMDLGTQLKIPQIPHNLFSLSTQIGQLFGIFLKKVPITFPLSRPAIR